MTFDRQKYKSFALMQLKGRWKTAVLGTLISIALLLLFSFTQSQTSNVSYTELINYSYEQLLEYFRNSPEYSAPGIIISIIQTIMDFIVEIVLVAFFLIFSRSPDPISIKKYFEGYNKWARGILCGLWRLLWTFLWGLLAIPLYLLCVLTIGFLPFETSMFTAFVVGPVVLLIGLIPMLIKSIEYSFAFYFAAEFPEVGVRKALRLSITIAKGHRWDIFVLELSFIGWFLLSFITFAIGFLWSLPYYYMTFTNTYHALLQDALESGKIKPEDLN